MFDKETWERLIQEFLLESTESIGHIERGLLELEANPESGKGLIEDVFRHMHTVKGNCRMLGFSRLEELAHCAENVLDILRDGTLTINRQIGSALLEVVDRVYSVLKAIEKNGEEGNIDFSILIDKLQHIQTTVTSTQNLHTSNTLDLSEFDFDDKPKPPDAVSTGTTAKYNTEESSISLETIHLPITRLDTLMNIIGTLVVTFNQLRYCLTQNRKDYQQMLDGMEQQLQQMQDEVLKYRLQPVGRVWETYHRLVRELAVESGKKVYLSMKGEDTEIDRTVLMSLKSILGHMIRNAIDHGIEPPDVRLAKGKSALGKVELSSEQRQGYIYMEIADDGAGIDLNRVKLKAAEAGLITPQQAQTIDDTTAFNLIMESGFSTTETVSKISGRGIGMDVVKKTVEKAGGTLSVSSTTDKGTCFSIRIPQTMAIVPVLLVSTSGEHFAVPQSGIVELLSFYGDEVKGNVEKKMHSLMVRSRERLLPLIRLKQVLSECDANNDNISELLLKEQCHVVILHSDEGDFGLEVDGIEETVNLVVKPLARMFSHISIISGTALMPEGTVSFLLNIAEIRKFQYQHEKI
ncbi:MAG: ATP-binding protein [Nitrospirae bacterium YQR-1]